MRLVQFETTDHVILPGLLYEPKRHTREAAIFLHGNGDTSVFYQARTNLFAEEMTRRGIAWFPFNNRGAYLSKRLKRSGTRKAIQGGTSYELIRDCVSDIDGAIRFLRGEGFRTIHLIGHSSGANKICVYDDLRKRNRAGKYVLLAPGDDVGLYYDSLGRRRFHQGLERCRERIALRRGDELVPESWAPFPISYRSLYDTINPNGRYNVFPFLETMQELRLGRKKHFREYSRLSKPTLTLVAENDEFCFGDARRCAEILSDHAPRSGAVGLVEGADHGFHGQEREVSALIADWLATRMRR